jgi:hypothetical protein
MMLKIKGIARDKKEYNGASANCAYGNQGAPHRSINLSYERALLQQEGRM